MTEKFKIKKIILWNIGVYFGISIPLLVGISYYSPITEMADTMPFLFFFYFTFGCQIFMNFVMSLCAVMLEELYLARAFFLSIIVVPVLEILIIFLIGFVSKFF